MPIVQCKICESDFYIKPSHQKLGWGKYCSIACRTKAQFLGKNVECTICGAICYKSPSRILHSKSGKFFCSKTCQTKWRNSVFSEQQHPNWSNGIHVYRKILLRSNIKQICFSCNIEDIRVLVTHHIDHNRENNNISNLCWVCHNCHYLIHLDKNFEDKFKRKLKIMVSVA